MTRRIEQSHVRSARALISHIQEKDSCRIGALERLQILALYRRGTLDLEEFNLLSGESLVDLLHQIGELNEDQDTFFRWNPFSTRIRRQKYGQ